MNNYEVEELNSKIRDCDEAVRTNQPWVKVSMTCLLAVTKIVDHYLGKIAEPDWREIVIRLPAGLHPDAYRGVVDLMANRGYKAQINDPKRSDRPVITENYLGIYIQRN